MAIEIVHATMRTPFLPSREVGFGIVKRSTVRAGTDSTRWGAYTPSDGVLLLKRDLLDQQIIDVHGRKVVRVNDVEIESTPVNGRVLLNVVSVDGTQSVPFYFFAGCAVSDGGAHHGRVGAERNRYRRDQSKPGAAANTVYRIRFGRTRSIYRCERDSSADRCSESQWALSNRCRRKALASRPARRA